MKSSDPSCWSSRTSRSTKSDRLRGNDHPRPLALYYFDNDDRNVERVLDETISGGVCTINETMLHIAQDDLPFGGVGPSGMGHYHAKEGFDSFSKRRPVFYQSRTSGTFIRRSMERG